MGNRLSRDGSNINIFISPFWSRQKNNSIDSYCTTSPCGKYLTLKHERNAPPARSEAKEKEKQMNKKSRKTKWYKFFIVMEFRARKHCNICSVSQIVYYLFKLVHYSVDYYNVMILSYWSCEQFYCDVFLQIIWILWPSNTTFGYF